MIRLRFAPSPTGLLHVGNARTALFNWLLARGAGGTFVLRIEDTDLERSTRQAEAGIIGDLRWLGLDWDEGPDVGGAHGPYRQSERLALYRSYAEELLAGGHAYYCFCPPEKLEAERALALARNRPPRYAGTCRLIDPDQARARVGRGEPAVVRFLVGAERDLAFDDQVRGEVTFNTSVIGDPILLRSDGTPAYNYAVVIDDALMAITDVVRGEDHISNTPRQLLIYEALGLEPPRFAHLSLVLGPDRTPLSKRHGATSVAEFRARGYLPEALVNYLALIGWSPGGASELLAVGELARRFSLSEVGHSAGVFDPSKLGWVNRHYLKQADPRRIAELSVPHLITAGYVGDPDATGLAFLASIVPLATGAIDRIDELPARLSFIFAYDPHEALSRSDVRQVLSRPGALDVVRALAEELVGAGRLDRDRFQAVSAAIRQRTGQKREGLFHPIRVVLTGEASGPELREAVPAIDRGAELQPSGGIRPVAGCRERAAAFAALL